MSTGWKFTYTRDAAGNGPQTIPLESLGLLEGVSVVEDGIKLSFRSHGACEMNCRVPDANPATAPKIAFAARITVTDDKGTPQFVGRRVDWGGAVSGNSIGTTYQFKDAWWDLERTVFKTTWFAGAYQAATLAGTTLTFRAPQLGTSQSAKSVLVYDANSNRLAQLGIVQWTSTTTATVSGNLPAGVAKATLLYQSTDVVLMQYQPGDPYQNSSQVLQYYITTGAQIREVLEFAISLGVYLQVGQIDPALYVPWYPARCVSCADAIKICLRSHPDCFTEIDYTTVPPTFNVRKRANLTPKPLPYGFTDANGVQHESTDVKPRPDLVPSRVGIFYRYLVNGTLVAWPTDIYPVGAPDGLLSQDYSLDLQGPRTGSTSAEITSVPFDPTSLAWWKLKCPALGAKDLTDVTMVDEDGNAGTAGISVTDANGNPIDYAGVFAWEMTRGTVNDWMTGVKVVTAVVTTFFSWQKTNSKGVTGPMSRAQSQSVRVKLVNTPSVLETFTQYLTTGEAIPQGLAQTVYQSLAELQYELSQSFKEDPFGGVFVKPGKHAVNLTGGDPAWQTMLATVQTTEYSLSADGSGRVFARAKVKCGPVEHLEAGQLVQLFNLFACRDLVKIDPWERITGTASPNSSTPATDDTALENSHPGQASTTYDNQYGLTPDANGNVTVIESDARTSGLRLLKWDGVTLNPDGTPVASPSRPSMDLDLSQIADADVAAGTGPMQFRKVGTDSNGKPMYLVASGAGSLSGAQDFVVVSDGGDYYNCNTWDGVTAGATIVKVAKHQDLRCTGPTANPSGGAWQQKTIRGVTYAYVYTPTASPTADGVNVVEYTRSVTGSDGSAETDQVTPCLNVGDIISAFQTSFKSPATLVGVTWQAHADGRAWASQSPS